jgi:hypothetical protein
LGSRPTAVPWRGGGGGPGLSPGKAPYSQATGLEGGHCCKRRRKGLSLNSPQGLRRGAGSGPSPPDAFNLDHISASFWLYYQGPPRASLCPTPQADDWGQSKEQSLTMEMVICSGARVKSFIARVQLPALPLRRYENLDKFPFVFDFLCF